MQGRNALLWTILLALLTACSFDNRSSDFACPTGNECESGRVCLDGWCVVSAQIDATPGGFVCPASCDYCNNEECFIDCVDSQSCASTVVCPPGIPCTVNCSGQQSCAGGVDCKNAASCEVSCDGQLACEARIDCGQGPCTVDCDGQLSCAGGLDCSNSCQCDSSCPDGTCDNHLCPNPDTCTRNNGCNDRPAACQVCQ